MIEQIKWKSSSLSNIWREYGISFKCEARDKKKKKILFDNHKANKTAFVVSIYSRHWIVVARHWNWSPIKPKDAFANRIEECLFSLSLSLSLYYFASYHSMLTVNHYHHSYFLLRALYNRLFRSQHQTARSRGKDKKESSKTSLSSFQQVSNSFTPIDWIRMNDMGHPYWVQILSRDRFLLAITREIKGQRNEQLIDTISNMEIINVYTSIDKQQENWDEFIWIFEERHWIWQRGRTRKQNLTLNDF